MRDMIIFCFMVVMICTAVVCIYGVWLATLCTIDLIKGWWEKHDKR